jgi:pyruvate/2-oxoglutarate dehydrogenase complex dihydrolipoamide acyltransferase (E2) component
MKIKVNFPKSGMGIEEGTVVRWLKTVGNTVVKGEPIVEIETAKATQEVEAPVSGRIVKIAVVEGEAVPVNAELALIEDDHG